MRTYYALNERPENVRDMRLHTQRRGGLWRSDIPRGVELDSNLLVVLDGLLKARVGEDQDVAVEGGGRVARRLQRKSTEACQYTTSPHVFLAVVS